MVTQPKTAGLVRVSSNGHVVDDDAQRTPVSAGYAGSDVNLLDVNVRKMFKFNSRFSVQPILEVFNVLNSNAIQSRTTVLGPAYGRAANIVLGRMVKFGMNMNF